MKENFLDSSFSISNWHSIQVIWYRSVSGSQTLYLHCKQVIFENTYLKSVDKKITEKLLNYLDDGRRINLSRSRNIKSKKKKCFCSSCLDCSPPPTHTYIYIKYRFQLYFRFITIFRRLFNQDLTWGKIGIKCTYKFCCSFGWYSLATFLALS